MMCCQLFDVAAASTTSVLLSLVDAREGLS
jgi:hypothetical protein